MNTRRLVLALLLLVAVSLAPSRVAAQDRRARNVSVSVVAGPSPYDLSGVGTGFAAGAWFDYPLKPFLLAEGGVGYFHYTEQFGARVTYLMPEAGLRAGLPLGAAFPYLGVGAGFLTTPSLERPEFTLHGLAGLRLWLTPRVGVRMEGRLRAIVWGATMTDLTGGLSLRL